MKSNNKNNKKLHTLQNVYNLSPFEICLNLSSTSKTTEEVSTNELMLNLAIGGIQIESTHTEVNS